MTHRFNRRTLLNTLLGRSAAQVLPATAMAADYPDRPIKFVIPFGAGGHVDNVGRLLAAAMGPLLSQPMVVDNRPVGCATSGLGSATHLTLERFNAQTGARLMHVPYRGGGSLVPDLIGGSVPVAAMEFSTALPLHKSGKVRILGVAGAHRTSLAPDVATFIESGASGFTAQNYVGLLAPVRTPKAALRKLEAAAASVLATSAVAVSLRATAAGRSARSCGVGLRLAASERA